MSDRAWGTVREDYSPDGDAWGYFPFEVAASRAYRWGEDGIAGICDNHQRICFALSLWNGRDEILKERLFGLSGPEGNHGEDIKECHYHLDATPTHSYLKYLYKYPQRPFPYTRLRREGAVSRSRPEFELIDTGIFDDDDRYFDVFTEYAKADAEDILIRITAINRGPEPSILHLLPTVWFRNTWSWGGEVEKPQLRRVSGDTIELEEPTLKTYRLWAPDAAGLLFTGNETNRTTVFGEKRTSGFFKDAFHEYVVRGRREAVNPAEIGTKAAAVYTMTLDPGESRVLRLRLRQSSAADPARDFDSTLDLRIAEADEFYASFVNPALSADARLVQRQAFAGLIWTKQFYHYVVEDWLNGDPNSPPPPKSRLIGRNRGWRHLFNDDIVSMPDKWEYPWYAAWDLAFHMIPFSLVDPEFAKRQLSLFLREWYMHPNGQIPAYEWNFSDVNPPVHAWACWRVYQIDAKIAGREDVAFLESVFHKLLMNFTWWVNRKDRLGNNVFEGGFLGLDNIGIFDRSQPLPGGGTLEQSDATAWMAMYCLNMLKMAIELAQHNIAYEDIASKFFEHFLHIVLAMNSDEDGSGLWDDEDGFYYDRVILPDGESQRLRIRSVVGLIPLFAVETIAPETFDRLKGFRDRFQWFLENRKDVRPKMASMTRLGVNGRRLLSLVGRRRLRRLLYRMLDESEFLSPYGIRSMSQCHADAPFSMRVGGQEYRVGYEPGESQSAMFGGNSNWRGPVWFPINYLLVESLQKFGYYHGDEVQVEYPTGSGNVMTLDRVAAELSRRLSHLFLADAQGQRPIYGSSPKLRDDPHFRDHVWFYEYFHGDTGAGLGANHQTGWTALVAKLLQQSGE